MNELIDLVFRWLGHRFGGYGPRANQLPATVVAEDRSFCRVRERGASLVEYALLVALIAVVCIGAVTFFGTELTDSLSTSGDSISN
ncbi:MAG: Flp family type IVb pilin [Actinomycetota bacterium]